MRYVLSIGLTVGAVLTSAAPATSTQSPGGQHASQPGFDVVLREVEAAQGQLVNGRPDDSSRCGLTATTSRCRVVWAGRSRRGGRR